VVTYKGFPRGVRGAVIATLALGAPFVLVPAVAAAKNPPASGGAALFGTTASVSISSGGHHYPGDSRHMGDRIIRPGMTGHDVRVLQAYLSMAGYQTTVDGQFGPTTKRNVMAFERARHLQTNGVVTWTVSQTLRLVVAEIATTAPPVQRARVVGGLAIAPSDAPAAVKAVIAAANRIAFKPYVYGGGHGSWNSSGYDCSGSVSYALHGGNLLSVTEDSSELESYGSAGAGRWITIWSNAGHAYMYVAGLRFDTSAQGSTGGSRWTTAGRSNAGFVERHPPGY
jgi:peptidoglycan hydrolase-like protein with peptidoglycan-binding domain